MVAVVIIISACSTHKNNAKSRFWHSFNARYNTYYNGTLAYIDGSLEKEKGNKDNFTEIIPLYTVGNKNSRTLGSGNFDKAIEKSEKAIKLHSIKKKPEWTKKRRKTEKDIEWLGRKEYNPMLWKAWMLMGRSQFYKGDFDAAAATFSYMSRLYQTQPAIYSKARAWLAKAYIEENWMYDAEDVIHNMQRDSIHWSARKEWDYTFADYYIHLGEYDKAIPYLQKVIKHEMRKKQKAREWFLLGQLYEKQGMKAEAYKAYKKVIRQNPPYELEFNARIAMTEVMAAGQSKQMISKLRRMARSDNNKDYLDQLYYAIGNIFLAQRDTLNAISAYEKGNVKSTRNGIEKGVLLLKLGNIYWEKEKYADAGRCYGEAIGLLDKERKDYKQLSDRSKKLDELVPYTEAVHLQDSLQALARMSEKERNAAIDRVIDALKKKEKEEKDKEAIANAERQQRANSMPARNNTNAPRPTSQGNSATWYFYNQMMINQGKTAFAKQWGKRENVDHWQRANKTVVNFDNAVEPELSETQSDSVAVADDALDKQGEADSLANDPHRREYYLAQIPFTEEQIAESNDIIMNGLYNAGVIFKDKLDNLKLSEKQFQRLETEYPSFEKMEDAYYHMFLLYSRMEQPGVAQGYIDKLKTTYPESKWTTLLTDPYYTENQKFGIHIEDSLYASTYEAFKANRHNEVRTNVGLSKERFPLGANRDKFVFISGLNKLNDGDGDGCLADMHTVVKDFPQSNLATMAGMIVNGVKEGKKLRGGRFDIGDVWARRAEVMNDSDSIAARQFVADKNIDFVFIIAYQPDSVNENHLLYELARYNFTSYMVRNFDLEIEDQDGLRVMKVSGFNNYEEAYEYAYQFYRQDNILERLGKSRTYIISLQNKELLGVSKSYDDYEKFYAENFAPVDAGSSQRLYEPSDTGRAMDDGGSIPGNISPILQKSANEQTGDANDDEETGVSEGGNTIMIEENDISPIEEGVIIQENEETPVTPDNVEISVPEENQVTPADDENTVIIDDQQQNAPVVQPADEPIIIIDPNNNDTPENPDETTIIIDEGENATGNDDSTTIVVDDKSEEGTDDEYFELEGF